MVRPRKKANLSAARARMYHELVLESAERVFAEQGFDESSMQDVAAEAGISLKTLYASTTGKRDLFREIVAQRGAGRLAAMQTSPDATALPRLALGVNAIVAYVLEYPFFFRILLQEGQAWGLNPRGEDGREAWREGLRALSGIIEQGVAEGCFAPVDVELTAQTVQAVIQVQLAGLLERTSAPVAEAIAAQILEPIERMLCNRKPGPGAASPGSASPGSPSVEGAAIGMASAGSSSPGSA